MFNRQGGGTARASRIGISKDGASRDGTSIDVASRARASETSGSSGSGNLRKRGRAKTDSSFGRKIGSGFLSVLMVFALCPAVALADETSQNTTESTEDNTFTFSDSGVTASDTDGSGFSIDGTELTITAAGTYVVTGSCASGNIIVSKGVTGVTLVLEDLSLTSTTGAPVVCKKTTNVVIDVEGTVTLTDGEDPDDEDSTDSDVADAFEGACIKAKDGATLTITGTGTLNLDGSSCKNGIKGGAETTLIIGESSDETFSIVANTANNCIASDGSVVINGGTIDVTSTAGDGIKSEPEEDDTASAGTVTVNGGTITIDAYGDGIQSTNKLTISDGTFDITTFGGASNVSSLTDDDSAKGIKSDSEIEIIGGDFTFDCADDAIHTNGDLSIASGTFEISTGDDAVHADYTVTIGTSGSTSTSDPKIDIVECNEGIEGATVNVYCGDIDIVSSDDAINAANSDLSSYDFELNIAGGSIYVVASGDGIDSNGTISFTGGTVEVSAPAQGDDTAIDCGDSSSWSVTDTTLLALGGSGMTPVMPSQGVYVNFGSGTTSSGPGGSGWGGNPGSSTGSSISVSEGSTVTVKDSSGNTLYETTAAQAATTALFASPDLVSGQTYTLYVNGTAVATATATGTATSSGSSGSTTNVKSIATATISAIPDQTYTGDAIEPDVEVTLDDTTLTEGTDYDVYYYSNIGVGTATVLVLGTGDYTGSLRTTFNIVEPDDSSDDDTDDTDISGATVAAIPDQTYTGDAIEPDVTVTLNGTTLVAGTDYYVTYSDNIEVGTATVTITGTGDYTGSTTATFNIVSDTTWTRLAGADRYETMGEILDESWEDESAETIILASGENFPDAISASALAGLLDAPLLISSSSELTDETEAEIERLASDSGATVIVVGGTGAISASVADSVDAIDGISVTRVSGSTRYETADEIYEYGLENGTWGETAIVVSGANYPDALSASSYAYADNAPVFLAEDGVLSESDAEAIRDGGFTSVIILGGNSAVDASAVESAIGDSSISYSVFAGSDRYETSSLFATWVTGGTVDGVSASPDVTLSCANLTVATGEDFPDALTSVNVAGKNSAPILLVSDDSSSTSFVQSNSSSIEEGYIIGGGSAVSEDLEELFNSWL
ncbi:MAG: carbohydrate-binding domain-containing protein [Coriobacteriales bacterium]|jgi:putative cell wall-binding protein